MDGCRAGISASASKYGLAGKFAKLGVTIEGCSCGTGTTEYQRRKALFDLPAGRTEYARKRSSAGLLCLWRCLSKGIADEPGGKFPRGFVYLYGDSEAISG